MAVRRVWGICDGADIQFERNAVGQWTAAVPADADNSYVVELWAEDDAGNVGYYATVLFTFDPITLQYTCEFLEVETEARSSEYCLQVEDDCDLTVLSFSAEYDLCREEDYELTVKAF